MAVPVRTYIYLIATLIICGTAIVINFATICAILFNKALRRRRNVFKFNLALADCTAAVGIFIRSLSDYPRIPFHLKNFDWNDPMLISGLLISIMSTLAIAVERLIVLRYDAHRQMVTAKRSIAICVIVWLIIPPTYICIFIFGDKFNEKIEPAFILGNVVLPCIIFICLVITGFCYAIIYKKIAMRPDSAIGNEAIQRRAKKRKRMLVMSSVLIVISTSGCWAIMCCALLIEALEYFGKVEEKAAFDILSDVGFTLVCLNQVLNPVIMWLRLSDFRGQLNACCFNRPICRRVFGFKPLHALAESEATTTSTNLQSITEENIGMREIVDEAVVEEVPML